jgi:hypothetical protein
MTKQPSQVMPSTEHREPQLRRTAKNARAAIEGLLAKITFLFSIFLLTSCINSVDEMRWKEEVTLHDGTIIVVERSASSRSSGFPAASRGPVVKQEFHYSPMRLNFFISNTSEEPISFDIFEGRGYLITLRHGSEGFCRSKNPGTYVANFYRFDGNHVAPIDQKLVPIELMTKNLTDNYRGATSQSDPAFISWRDQAERDNFEPNHPMPVTQLFEQNKFLRCP